MYIYSFGFACEGGTMSSQEKSWNAISNLQTMIELGEHLPWVDLIVN